MASNSKVAALKELKNFAGMLKNLMALSDELGEAGTLERSIAESQKQLEALKAELATAHEAIEEAQQQRADIIIKAENEANKTKLAADSTRRDADALRLTADKVLDRAKEDAAAAALEGERLIAKGEAQAAEIVAAAKAEANELAAKARRRLSEVEAQIKAADDRYDAEQRKISEATQRLADLNSEIDRLKARFTA